MAIESLSILTQSGSGHAYLAVEYGKVIENVQNGTISGIFKNQDIIGETRAGTALARRFVNATVNNYGTASSGGGTNVRAADVLVNIDQHKEIVEIVEDFDARTFGVEGLVQRRLKNHQDKIIKLLEREFWNEAWTAGTVFTPSENATTVGKKIDELITSVETTKSDFVDGVYRYQMGLVLNSPTYTALQENIDTIPNVKTGNTYQLYHNIRVFLSTDLPTGVDAICIVDGAIAQPFWCIPDEAGKVPMKNAYHFGIFIDYGTKAVSPELIKYIGTAPETETEPSEPSESLGG